jgi:hypothetical protein
MDMAGRKNFLPYSQFFPTRVVAMAELQPNLPTGALDKY